jgi:protease-4
VVSIIFSADDPEYFAAAASDKVWVVPQSMLLINGLTASVTFLGQAMDKLGVKWDVARVGKYKNAPDQLTRADMSAEQREVINAYLDTESNHLVKSIAQMRNIPPDQVSSAQKIGLITPKQAVELGLVDDIVKPSELEGKLKEFVLGGEISGEYQLEGTQRGSWGSPPVIAVVPIVGTISSGRSRSDPVGVSEVAGVETVVDNLQEVASDPSVKAIILRVDSGGGDALASDLMYRAVQEAAKKKPVIASMGNLAASGGYYAAMGAQKIYADSTTLTGSIGVFILKPAVGPLARKLGINNETIKRGNLSNLFSAFDPWTPEEQAAAQKWVDAFYDDFLTVVADARKLPKEQVDQIARGHVWSGEAAKDLKLVDELGTMFDAIDEARREAGLPEDGNWKIRMMGEAPALGVATPPFLSTALPEPLRRTIEELGIPSMTLLEPGLKAQQPFEIRIK